MSDTPAEMTDAELVAIGVGFVADYSEMSECIDELREELDGIREQCVDALASVDGAKNWKSDSSGG